MRTVLSILLFLATLLRLTAQEGVWQFYYPDGIASSLAADGNTILAATFDNGLVQFDTLGNRTFFTPVNSGIPAFRIWQVAIDQDGYWWVQYDDGFARYDGENWQSWTSAAVGLPDLSYVNVLRAAPGGGIYVGTTDRGVAVYQNGAWSLINSTNSGLTFSNVKDIAFGQNGKVYYSGLGGLAVQDGANWTLHNNTSTGLNTFNDNRSVSVTNNGTIWVTAGSSGFAKLEAGIWTAFTPADIGLSAEVGRAGRVFADQFDRLWLTFSKSVSVLENGVWTNYADTNLGCTEAPNLVHTASPVVDGAGQVWVTTCDLALFDGTAWSQLNTGNSGLPQGQTHGIAQGADSKMWFAGGGGVANLDGDTWTGFKPVDFGASDDFSYSALSTPSGELWFGLHNSELLHYDGIEFNLVDTCSTAFPNSHVNASALAPNGDRWFSFSPSATFSAQLARLSNGAWNFYTPLNTPLPATADISTIAVGTDGAAWFGSTSAGLHRFDGAGWTTFNTTNSGLPGNRVRDLAFSSDGALWICTDQGLARFDGANWTTLTTTNSDILANNLFNIAFDAVGGMYIGYGPLSVGAKCAVLRDDVWTTLVPPGLETTFNYPPNSFMVDRDNRLWFSFAQEIGVFVYDPMIVGTEESDLPASDFAVFPNPTTGQFTLKMATARQEETQLRILNLQGQIVYTATVSVTNSQAIDLDIRHLPAGVYSVTVVQNGLVKTGKVVKG